MHEIHEKNKGKLKLLTIVGTRPEIIRLSEVIKLCDVYFDQYFCHTGQNYDKELYDFFIEGLGLRQPDYYLSAVGENLGHTVGNIIAKSYDLMVELNPDAVLVLGDTNSCLAAIPAKRLHIPVFHMEAGNRCGDLRLPEEINRHIVDVTADVNMCYSEHARRYLLSEGMPAKQTYVTGSPMAEVLTANLEQIQASNILEELGLEEKKYMLLSAHREENIDSEKSFYELFNAINALAEKYQMPILYSCDSGTLPEESSFFTSVGKPFPAVCVRTSTERPEALDKGCFILAGITEKEVLQAVDVAVEMVKNGHNGIPVPDYVDTNVSSKVVKIIQSYVGIVNRMTWRKY